MYFTREFVSLYSNFYGKGIVGYLIKKNYLVINRYRTIEKILQTL
jgi:hypothetical protein